MKVTIACVLKSGGIYTPDYVDNLLHMVKKNISYDFEFVCLTDLSQRRFDPDVRAIPFEVDFPWKWCKINLFNPSNPFHERVLALDLDSLILRSLDPTIEFDSDFALPRQWKNIGPRFGRDRVLTYKTPVMVWNHNARPELWDDFRLGTMQRLVGDQDWVGERLPNEDLLPDGWFDEQRYYNRKEDIPSKCIVLGITDKAKNKGAAKKYRWIQKIWEGGNHQTIKRKTTQQTAKKVRRSGILTVVTWLWGNWFGRGEEYVQKLQASVARNLSMPHRFICITDRDYIPYVETVSLESPITLGNLKKLSLYSLNNGLSGPVFALDLDNVIVGSLDDICSYEGSFCIRAAFRTKAGRWIPDGDIMMQNLSEEDRKAAWDFIEKYKVRIQNQTKGAERKFYKSFHAHLWSEMDFLQQLYPGQVLSYKQDGLKGSRLPEDSDARIVSFHGHPKPHEIEDEWVHNHWTRNEENVA